nr:MAG TPA: hypothetical protein [Caudoviricetes sp.]DAZ04976.1 MAG TPA: hypothetical protein [Caudoviricetes sp.]
MSCSACWFSDTPICLNQNDTLCYQLSSPIRQDKSKFENLTVFPYMQMIHFAVIIGLPTTRESG